MEFNQLVAERRSYRKFEAREVDQDTLSKIFEATLTAPSSKSSRSSRFMVVTNKDLLEKISVMRSRGASFIKDAPMAIIALGDKSISDLWVDNCAISITIMQLAIHNLGLGSCWVQVHDRMHNEQDPAQGSVEDYLRTLIDIPEDWAVSAVVALGYPTDIPAKKKEYDDTDKIIYVK